MTTQQYHPVRLSVGDLLKDCTVRRTRRSGPGGQHRNKTESAVVIRHCPTGVEGQAAERRSQLENHQMAVKRLRMNLALKVRCEDDGETAPSELWKSRCQGRKIFCNADHLDFAILIAEALDVIAAQRGRLTSSAAQLGCTATQLVKFLAKESSALEVMNKIRQGFNLPPRKV